MGSVCVGSMSLGYQSRSLFLQDKLERALDSLGLGGSFIMPDADGLSKYVIISAIYHSSKKANNQRKYRTSKLFAQFIRSLVNSQSMGWSASM